MKKVFAFIAVIFLLALAGCASEFSEHVKDVQKPDPNMHYEIEGNTARCTSPNMVIEASYLSPENVDMYFSIFRGGKYKNPYPPVYMVFLLSIENKGKKAITFNPGLAWLAPEKQRPTVAKDYSSLYANLDIVNAEDIDERMEAVKASTFDTAETIQPGTSVKKLIVFTRGQEPFDKAVIILNNLYSGRDCRDVKFIFPGGLGMEQDKEKE